MIHGPDWLRGKCPNLVSLINQEPVSTPCDHTWQWSQSTAISPEGFWNSAKMKKDCKNNTQWDCYRYDLCSVCHWLFYLLQLPADQLLPHTDLNVRAASFFFCLFCTISNWAFIADALFLRKNILKIRPRITKSGLISWQHEEHRSWKGLWLPDESFKASVEWNIWPELKQLSDQIPAAIICPYSFELNAFC